MAVKVLTQADFSETINNSAVPVVVDFYADWCAPCKRIAPLLEELSVEKEGEALFCKIDVDENQDIAEEFNIMSIPYVVCFKNGKPFKNVIGAVPKDELLALIN